MGILLETKADSSTENSFGAGHYIHKQLIEGKMFPLERWQEGVAVGRDLFFHVPG